MPEADRPFHATEVLRAFGETPEEQVRNVARVGLHYIDGLRALFDSAPEDAVKVWTEVRVRGAFLRRPEDGDRDG